MAQAQNQGFPGASQPQGQVIREFLTSLGLPMHVYGKDNLVVVYVKNKFVTAAAFRSGVVSMVIKDSANENFEIVRLIMSSDGVHVQPIVIPSKYKEDGVNARLNVVEMMYDGFGIKVVAEVAGNE